MDAEITIIIKGLVDGTTDTYTEIAVNSDGELILG